MGEENKKIFVIFWVNNNSVNQVLVKLLKNYIIKNEVVEENQIFDVLDDSFQNDEVVTKFLNQVWEITKSENLKYIYLNFYWTDTENEDFISWFKITYNLKSFKDYLS